MPRQFSQPSANYAVATYGPFSIDGFTNANTEYLELTLTVENWPDVNPCVTGQLRWETGDGADFSMNGIQRNRDGTLQTIRSVQVGVPRRPDGKAIVGSATVLFNVLVPIRTAVTLKAV